MLTGGSLRFRGAVRAVQPRKKPRLPHVARVGASTYLDVRCRHVTIRSSLHQLTLRRISRRGVSVFLLSLALAPKAFVDADRAQREGNAEKEDWQGVVEPQV